MARAVALAIVPPAERTERRPYIALGLLQVLDVAMTGVILYHWGEHAESNPLARFILTNWGLWLGMTIMLILKMSAVGFFYICQTGVKIVSALYSLVIANNVLFLGLWAWQILQ